MTIGVVLAIVGGYGTHLVFTALAHGWNGLAWAPRHEDGDGPDRLARLKQTMRPDVIAAAAGSFFVTFAIGYALFGGVLPATAGAAMAAVAPVAAERVSRQHDLAHAQDSWPWLIEEIRVLTGSVGRSIPQALLEAGAHAPAAMAPAFAAARHEWSLSTDFSRTVAVLKAGLADPTADAACETLLVAYEIGGGDLDRRLGALIDDRVQDVQGRKDARAKQAGVRFARRFVLLVPLGMALAGLSIGNGRGAYATLAGQLMLVAGVAIVACCWFWAGRLLRLPTNERVFVD